MSQALKLTSVSPWRPTTCQNARETGIKVSFLKHLGNNNLNVKGGGEETETDLQ